MIDDSTLFISHNLIIFVVLILFTSSLLITFLYRPGEFEKTRIKLFFSTLASIAVLLVGFNLLLTSMTSEYNRLYTKTVVVRQLIDKLWLQPNQLLATSVHARPEFLASFSYNNIALYQTALKYKSNTPLTVQTILEEQNFSIVILQTWEDFFGARAFDENGTQSWIGCFLVWAQSPYLKEYFHILKYNYNATTIKLANLLFEYAEKLPIPNPDPSLYSEAAKKLMKDPRLIKLLAKAPR